MFFCKRNIRIVRELAGGVMKCQICGSNCKSIHVIKKKWEKEYYKCTNCEFIFVAEEELLDRDRERIRYEGHNNSVEDEGYKDYFRRFIDYSFDGISKKNKILDYGSGPEPVLKRTLNEEGYNNVEIYDKFFKDDETPLKLKYNLITSTEVVEHIYNPMDTFRLMASLLEEEGTIVIMTNFHENDTKKFEDWWYITDPTHVVFYSLRTFEEIAKMLRLEIVKTNNKNIVVFRRAKDDKIF